MASFTEFKFLVSGENGTAVQDVYDTPEKLGNHMVIRDEYSANRYLVFDSPECFVKWQNTIPLAQRCFHEIIFGPLAQRIKFDIDIMSSLSEVKGADKITEIIDSILSVIVDELFDSYYETDFIMPTKSALAVCDSSGQTTGGYKYSFHIIVLPYVVANNIEAGEFTNKVIGKLPDDIKKFIDPNVNKRIQSFRLLGSHKPNSSRFKTANAETAARFGTAR